MAPKLASSKTITFKHVFTQRNPGKIDDFYKMDRKVMGEGSYGQVVKGADKATGNIRAIKAIDVSKISDPTRFEIEVSIQQSLDHPHIVKLFEVFKDAKRVYLVLELCTGGELFDRIVEEAEKHGEGQAFDEKGAATYMQQILGAMRYLHAQNFVHRDIKPENFLLSTPQADAVIKVIDFGLAKEFASGSKDLMRTKAGTPYYVAPQVLAGAYCEKADIWSCGVIAYILLCGYPPFHGDTDEQILRRVRHGSFDFPSPDWDAVSSEGKDFITRMLTMKEDDRPSAEDLLAHPWLTKEAEKVSGRLVAGFSDKMKTFRAAGRMKKVALTLIASQLNDDAIEDLKRSFAILDVNKDGCLSVQEMREGMSQAGIAIPPDMEEIMKQVDSDGSGNIDYTEFIAATITTKQYAKREVMWAAFRVFDVDGDGEITREELKSVLSDADEAVIGKMIGEIDLDGDGTINFDEFCEMMTAGTIPVPAGAKS